MVKVNVKNATAASCSSSSGLLGSFPDGLMLARDGATIMEDDTLFGQEWQVQANDPKLFGSSIPIQHVAGLCVPPVSEGRHLGERNQMKAAEKACAHHKDRIKKDMCVFDVTTMTDLEVVEVHGTY